MAATLDVTAADGVLKQRYPSKKVAFLGYKGNPFLSLVPKDTEFGGDVMKMPLWFGGNQGASRVFATAQANKTSGLYDAFLLTRKKDYALSSIELEAIQASMNDAMAFMRLATAEIDNTVRTAGRNLAVSLYRNTGGARGRVGSVSTTTLTLKNINDIVNFEVGMKVTSSNTDGTSGADDAQEIAITAINRIAGTLTAAVTWTAGGNFSNDDYIFRSGDFGVSCAGLDAWIPASAPGSTPFFGVDRSRDVTRLGGLRYDGSSETIEEGLQSAEILASREGANPDYCFMNPQDFGDLRKSLGSKVEYDVARSPDVASISFRTLVLQGTQGPIKIVSDRNCPQGVAYLLQMDTWVLASLGPAPKILANDAMGLQFLWDQSADSIEIRAGYYANLGCYCPGYNMRVTLPA